MKMKKEELNLLQAAPRYRPMREKRRIWRGLWSEESGNVD